METEIKLLLAPQSRGVVESHPLFAGAEARAEEETTTYFDTPDFALRDCGAILRIRASERGFVQTVKLKGGVGSSAVARREWEWPVAGNAIDPGPIVAEPAIRRRVKHLVEKVAPVFETRIRRTRRHLWVEGKTDVEAVIDEGTVSAGAKRAAIAEVELELKGGPVAPLFRLAADLSARAALRFGPEAKSDRGYALLSDAPQKAPDAPDLVLPKDLTIGEAFPQLVDATLRDFAADLPAAARGDVEGIHRLRAAVRKLRTLLTLFGPFLEPGGAADHHAKLRNFGGILGQGRDWDVFLTETLAKAAEAIGEDKVAPLRVAAAARDAASHRLIGEAVAGPVPTEVILGLGSWTADSSAWLVGDPARRLADLVPELLDALVAKARKRHKTLRDGEPEDLHRLRKAMKKLRYGVEDVASLFKHKPVERHLARIKPVLAALGDINDAAVTDQRIAELAPVTHLGWAATDLLDWNARRRRKALRAFAAAWHRFAETPAFWA